MGALHGDELGRRIPSKSLAVIRPWSCNSLVTCDQILALVSKRARAQREAVTMSTPQLSAHATSCRH